MLTRHYNSPKVLLKLVMHLIEIRTSTHARYDAGIPIKLHRLVGYLCRFYIWLRAPLQFNKPTMYTYMHPIYSHTHIGRIAAMVSFDCWRFKQFNFPWDGIKECADHIPDCPSDLEDRVACGHHRMLRTCAWLCTINRILRR